MPKRKIIKKIAVRSEPIQSEITVTTRPRAMAVCKLYNVSFDTLTDYLIRIGYGKIKSNELLENDLLEIIKKEFTSDKIEKDKLRGNTNLNFINPKTTRKSKNIKIQPVIKSNENLLQDATILLKNDIFKEKSVEIQYKQLPVLSSYFSDMAAINICKKMNSSYARELCKKYYLPKENSALIRYQLHYIANKALVIFGSKILTFIFGLRQLKFKNNSAIEIRNYQKVIPDFPIITLITKDEIPFRLTFYIKKIKNNNTLKGDVRLYNFKNNEQIGYIDEQGYILSKLNKFTPSLSLFYESISNNSYSIYSGVESGTCAICGRDLTDSISLRIGVGPTCAQQIGIDFSLYQ